MAEKSDVKHPVVVKIGAPILGLANRIEVRNMPMFGGSLPDLPALTWADFERASIEAQKDDASS